jgi:subtilase family serine protease
MKKYRKFVVVMTAALVLGLWADASLGSASGPSGLSQIRGTASPAASNANDPRVGSVAPASAINFEVQLKLTQLGAARAFATAVSTPGSASYGKYLTPAQWEARFSPTAGQVAEVSAFLRSSGFKVLNVTPDRMAIDASGTAAQVEHAFATSLAYYNVAGTKLRLANRDLSVPAALAGIVAGATGISQTLARPADTTDNPVATPSNGPSPNPPPAGFRVAPPCGTSYGQKLDTALKPYGNGYPSPAPWAVCGYAPPQLRSAYSLNGAADGSGVTVAITDAYASPTLEADAQKYASINDPTHPLLDSQFGELLPSSYNLGDLCGPSGWYGEQTLDVEAVHATAPGAHILYVGAENCFGELFGAVRTVVDHHLADVVTNSWLDLGGDVLDDASLRSSFDNVLMMAAGEGISVLYASGDNGDDFTTLGAVVGNYPATSPWATAVGGTTLQIGAKGQRVGEFGWSTARSFLCNEAEIAGGGCTDAQRGAWLPINEALDGGSGGGTSFVYHEPAYQVGVVPTSLAEFNGPEPMRVYPDISMEADPATGFLVGETQTFPNGVYYDQYRIGGTSVASPLLAGVIARADETAGHPLGFVNPKLYSLSGDSSAIDDVLAAGKQDMSRSDFANSVDASNGFLFSTRIVDYEGGEHFCTDDGTCFHRPVALNVTPGYDNMTGLGSPGDDFIARLSAP